MEISSMNSSMEPFDSIEENVIEWFNGEKIAELSITQKSYIKQIKKLKDKYPDDVKLVENKDGSIFATLPVEWIQIKPLQVEVQQESDQTIQPNKISKRKIKRQSEAKSIAGKLKAGKTKHKDGT